MYTMEQLGGHVDIKEFMISKGITSTTIKDLEGLQVMFLREMSRMWEWNYKKYKLFQSNPEDTETFEEYDRQQKLVVDDAMNYYRIIWYIREQYYKMIKSDPALIKQELELCKKDYAHFINTWCYVHEPRNVQMIGTDGESIPTALPFIMYPAQRRVIDGIDFSYKNNMNFMVGKSREAGISWGFMAWGLHKWLFYDGFRMGVGSEKADKVDVLGSSNPLMGKMRYMLYNLPEFFRPPSMKYDKNSYDNQFRLIHPKLGSEILGEVGENIGRSGRYSVFIIDEAQDLSAPQKADEGLESATRCRGDVGTARGMNHFGRKWKAKSSINYQIMWYEDPRKTAKWAEGKPDMDCYWRLYTEEVNKDNPEKIAQEYDMDFQASVTDICIPGEWVQMAVGYDLEQESNPERIAGFDIAGSGKDSSVVIIREGNRIDRVAPIEEKEVTRSMWKAHAIARDENVLSLNYDKVSIGEAMYGLLVDSDVDIPYQLVPVDGGTAAGDFIVEDRGEPASKVFYNLRAMIWWNLRERFKKTYEHRKGIREHPLSEQISIPDNKELIEQLSYPKLLDRNGRKLIESKKEMRGRNIPSPDYADATAYAFFDDYSVADSRAIRSFRLSEAAGNFSSIPVESVGRWQYVVSLTVSDTNEADVVFTRYKEYGGVFQVIEELHQDSLRINELIQNISSYVNPQTTEFDDILWVGNKELFVNISTGKAHIVELFRKKNIRLRENYEEDDRTAMIVIDELFREGRVVVSKSCKHLATQLSMVTISHKKIDKRYGLVKALLLVITYMKESSLPIVETKLDRGYNKSSGKDINRLIQDALFS